MHTPFYLKNFKKGVLTMNHFNLAKEEFSLYGSEGTNLQNLLAILIGSKADASVTGSLAGLGVSGLSEISKEELLSYSGIGEISANRILAAFSLGTLFNKQKKEPSFFIRSPEDAAKYLDDMKFLNQEYFEVLFLNTKNMVLARRTIFKGSLNASICHPREVFKEALKLSAASIIVAHNHPSGNPQPSREDIEVTKRLVEVAKIMGIELLDHIIIGKDSFSSIKELGYL
jgi:DNA repair protein RadC